MENPPRSIWVRIAGQMRRARIRTTIMRYAEEGECGEILN